MKLHVFCGLAMLSALAPLSKGQMSDRCSPGWSMLNQLREQLAPDLSGDALQLLQVRIQRHLRACPEIPDLWYYRALVDDRLKDTKDATLSRKEAESRGSGALRGQLNPFDPKAAPEPAVAALPNRIRQKFALVVGINEFENAPRLNYAVNDAQGVADALTDQQAGRFPTENVFRLVNQEATLTGVRTAIGKIRERAGPEDLVVIYIASHGSPRQDDPNGVSYVVMHDTKIDNAADLYATSLQMIELVEILGRDMRAKREVLILDTCYSGDATGTRGMRVHSPNSDVGPQSEFSAAADRFEDKTVKGVARVVISASRADEQSREDPKLQHGFFTYFLLDSLRKNGGMSPLSEVFQSVHDRTSQAVRERFGVSQTPTVRSTSEGLNIVLGLAGGE
jgi:uncharacterized caspase-like protein